MGLVDAVLAHREEREAIRSADPVTLEEFGYLLGRQNGSSFRTRSGTSVGPQRALGIAAWWRGVRYLTETIAGLPAKTYSDRGGVRTEVPDRPWRKKPDIETPWFALIELWMMSLLHKGNAYAFKLRNDAGQVIGLRGLHPDRVKPGTYDGVKVFQVDNRTDIGFTTREILHIPGLSYDGVCGLNPIQAHAETLGIIVAAESNAAQHFGSGQHLRAYISLPQKLTDEQAEELKARWEKFHTGMANASDFGVLGNGAEYKTVSLNPGETQLLETRKYGVTEVARILGVVPHKLYDLDRATFSNIEHQAIESVTDGILPWLTRIEAWLNFDPDLMSAQTFLEFIVDGLLRGDTATRYAAYSSAVGGPWMSGDEARALENLPPAGLERVLSPLNMTPAGSADQPAIGGAA